MKQLGAAVLIASHLFATSALAAPDGQGDAAESDAAEGAAPEEADGDEGPAAEGRDANEARAEASDEDEDGADESGADASSADRAADAPDAPAASVGAGAATPAATDSAPSVTAATPAAATSAAATSAAATSAAATSAAATSAAATSAAATPAAAAPTQATDAGDASEAGDLPAVRIGVAVGEESADRGAGEADDKGHQLQPGQPPGALEQPGGFSVSVGARMSAGQSIFQRGNQYERDPTVTWGMSLSPGFMFPDMTRVGASIGFSQELTTANGDDDPQTLIVGDTQLSVSRPIYAFEDGPNINGSLSAQIPTSTASRVSSLVTSLGLGASVSQPVGGVFLSFSSGFRKNFHRYTHPTRNPNTGQSFTNRDGLVFEDLRTGIARQGGNELSGATYFNGDANNTSMVLSNGLSLFYPASEKVGLGMAYNLSHSWTYESFDLDELSGVGARAGRGRRDSHGGTLFANYTALPTLRFGLSMSTGGPTRSADDKRIRFPFFNFDGPESNMTSFTLSVTLTEAVPL